MVVHNDPIISWENVNKTVPDLWGKRWEEHLAA
jgi:hypothetical protein